MFLLFGLGTHAAAAQAIDATPQCPECRIRLDTVTSTGDPEGPGVVPKGETIARGPGGRFYVMSTEAQVIQVFSPDGTFVHSFGREGEGPGELRFPVAMHIDDTGRVFVPDARQQRLTIFDRDFEVERTVRLPPELMPGFELFTLPDDSVVMSGHSLGPELFGLSVHVISPEGERIRSFGERGGAVLARDPNRTRREMARADSGFVWIGSRYDEYRIELWTLAGQRVEAFEAEVDWFEPIQEEPGHPSPPEAHLYSMREDEDGLLWLLFSIPDPRWREAAVRDGGAPHGWRMENEEYWTDTVVDVVDPSARRLLARTRLDEPLGNLFGATGVYTSAKDLDLEELSLRFHIVRLDLVGRER